MKIVCTFILVVLVSSCSVSRRIARSASENILEDGRLKSAHIGICIYDAAEGRFLYDHQSEKYFVPASNTKIATCYAAMKYLGDSLAGLRYLIDSDTTWILPTGDPSFLHPQFSRQPALDFLKKTTGPIAMLRSAFDSVWRETNLGEGWSWNDYNEDYMAERSALPLYGNVVHINVTDPGLQKVRSLSVYPSFFNGSFQSKANNVNGPFRRAFHSNHFYTEGSEVNWKQQGIPFLHQSPEIELALLDDTLSKAMFPNQHQSVRLFDDSLRPRTNYISMPSRYKLIYSRPIDSVLKPMMHNSDNFFAEQILLMVSDKLLGYMNDEHLIDSLLRGDLRTLPQKPNWVDGCGLSRYNLFTPRDLVHILLKLKEDVGMTRVKEVFASGNEGTLKNYYTQLNGRIFAKTGTMSGVLALSGYLYTKKNKLLVFSFLVNNHQTSAVSIRRDFEKILSGLYERM